MKINANDELDLVGNCIAKCDGLGLTYTFFIYMLNYSSNNWIPLTNNSYFHKSAESESNLIVLKDLFKPYSRHRVWKIELRTTLFTYTNQNLTTDSSVRKVSC